MTPNMKTSIEEGILSLTFDRPEKRNALTDAMYGVLADSLEKAATDPAIRVVLLQGEGDSFTAGNDVGEFAAIAMGGEMPRNVLRFLNALAGLEKPVVAAVQGRAVGVGTTMLLHCDHIVVSDDAKLSAPFVSLALTPEAASSLLLPAIIGHVRAFSVFALGEVIAAEDAVALGLANRVVARSELARAALDVARRLSKQPLGALVVTKRLMRHAPTIVKRMSEEGHEFRQRLVTAEAREAFTAFAERRAPDFTKLG